MRSAIICLLMLVLVATAAASPEEEKKVYVYRDANGVLVFSDKPHPGATEVNLNKHRHLTMPAEDTTIFQRLQNQSKQEAPGFEVIIDTPEDKATIRDNNGDIQISGHVTPSFRDGYQVRLLLDGKPRQKPHSTVNFRLHNVDRGEHTLVLELLDSHGKVVARSQARTIYLFRASSIKPNQS